MCEVQYFCKLSKGRLEENNATFCLLKLKLIVVDGLQNWNSSCLMAAVCSGQSFSEQLCGSWSESRARGKLLPFPTGCSYSAVCGAGIEMRASFSPHRADLLHEEVANKRKRGEECCGRKRKNISGLSWDFLTPPALVVRLARMLFNQTLSVV